MCVYVGICGYMWVYVGICVYMWVYVVICGYMWVYVDILKLYNKIALMCLIFQYR